MGEIWRDILELEGAYSVSNLGRIRNNKSNKIRKTKLITYSNGSLPYEHIVIRYKRKYYSYYVHRLVMIAFEPKLNIKNLHVNHINHDTLDNTLKNLEWVTVQENIDKKRFTFVKHSKTKELLSKLLNIYSDEELVKVLSELDVKI